MDTEIKTIIIGNEKNCQLIFDSMVALFYKPNSIKVYSDFEKAKLAILDYQPDLIFVPKQINEFDTIHFFSNYLGLDFKIIFYAEDFSNLNLGKIKFMTYAQFLLFPYTAHVFEKVVTALIKIILFEKKVVLEKQKVTNMNNENKITENIGEHIVFVKGKKGEDLPLKVNQLHHFAADGKYCNVFYIENGKLERIHSGESIGDFETKLAKYNIIKIHRSYLVNIAHIKKHHSDGGHYVLMRYPDKDGQEIHLTISDTQLKEVKRILGIK